MDTHNKSDSDSPYTSPQADAATDPGASTFSLATLMVIIALCAVGFGITYYAIGLGVAFFIMAALAFARVKLHHRTGWVHGFEGTALAVTLVILLTPICCGVAFFTNCFAGAFGAEQLSGNPMALDLIIFTAFGLGGITALQTGELIFALCLRKKNDDYLNYP